MAEKIFDLCVIVSKYKDTSGKEKCRYQHIGAEMVNAEGKHFIVLNPWVNLAGIPMDSTRNSVFVCKFPPRYKSDTRGELYDGEAGDGELGSP
jgi:hypothetical protein